MHYILAFIPKPKLQPLLYLSWSFQFLSTRFPPIPPSTSHDPRKRIPNDKHRASGIKATWKWTAESSLPIFDALYWMRRKAIKSTRAIKFQLITAAATKRGEDMSKLVTYFKWSMHEHLCLHILEALDLTIATC